MTGSDPEEPPIQPAQTTPARCLNCEEELLGPYCHKCGQKDIPTRETLGEIFGNFVSSFWSYEGKFWRTIKNLVLRPGYLPHEFVEGRRERYFHPARMYVFISFVFFLLVTSQDESEQLATRSPGPRGDREKAYTYQSFGLSLSLANSYRSVEQYDSLQMTLPEADRESGLARWLSRREIELTTRYASNAEFQRAFDGAYSENVSKVFFWELPVFALLLMIFYRSSGYRYAQHLVFSVYFYDLFFLLASILFSFGYVTSLWIIADPLLYLSLLIYFVVALRRMYGGSWVTTLLKAGAFILLLSICIGLGLFINLLVTLAVI